MKFVDDVQDLDAAFIKACMEKMDPDVATRFVLSGVSLDKTKIEDAFALACREMAIRAEERAAAEKKLSDKLSPLTDSKEPYDMENDEGLSSKTLLKIFEDVLASATKKTK